MVANCGAGYPEIGWLTLFGCSSGEAREGLKADESSMGLFRFFLMCVRMCAELFVFVEQSSTASWPPERQTPNGPHPANGLH